MPKEKMVDTKNNTGLENSGSYNSGDCNSGNRNSGSYNSGSYNSGSYNSGDCNSGNRNSGNRNSGSYNSGSYNSGDYNSGHFNTDEPNARMFNKDTGKKLSEIIIPYIALPVTEWLSESEMTDEQKKADPQFYVKGGTLIKRTYKEAWKKAWGEIGKQVQDQFLALPNFDAALFLEITGIDVKKAESTCDGKVVEIDGKRYKLSEVK